MTPELFFQILLFAGTFFAGGFAGFFFARSREN